MTRLVLPDHPDADDALEAFLGWVADQGLELYPAQEEAILALFAGNHVILTTPTGSGKSLVAVAAHATAMAAGERSWYTAPIKALVSEKFFDLIQIFGANNVGMLTGDAAVNAGNSGSAFVLGPGNRLARGRKPGPCHRQPGPGRHLAGARPGRRPGHRRCRDRGRLRAARERVFGPG